MLRFVMFCGSKFGVCCLTLLLFPFLLLYSDACTSQVGCRLMQFLMETAYIQPPVDQFGDSPPDIRPAFVHTLKSITKEAL